MRMARILLTLRFGSAFTMCLPGNRPRDGNPFRTRLRARHASAVVMNYKLDLPHHAQVTSAGGCSIAPFVVHLVHHSVIRLATSVLCDGRPNKTQSCPPPG